MMGDGLRFLIDAVCFGAGFLVLVFAYVFVRTLYTDGRIAKEFDRMRDDYNKEVE